ncbi:MAG: hypothetical protein K0Q70_903 [Rhodospirillales bacterium]|jgi:hypothetical protein|nr:hypothetical protein [Rhodospirillales bacterium]
MIAEFRTYTINRGMMESYLDLYNKQIVPNHKLWGIQIIGAWVEKNTNKITWIRIFKDEKERAEKLKAYEEGPDRSTVMPVASHHMTAVEVKIMQDVLNPSPEPDTSPLKTETAKKAYAEFDPKNTIFHIKWNG